MGMRFTIPHRAQDRFATVATVVSIALPNLVVRREQARDVQVKLMLTTAARGETVLDPETDGHTDDRAVLEVVSPVCDSAGSSPESIPVAGGGVEEGDRGQVLFYSRSRCDRWCGVRLVGSGPEGGWDRGVGGLARMTPADGAGLPW